ncbi:MAG: DUF3307 domain-containing protein, partial [Pseudomonadota bacterium]
MVEETGLMAETLITLIAAHILADFLLQTRSMVENKARIVVLLVHVAIVTALSAMFLGAFDIPILSIIAVSHFAFDYIKQTYTSKNLTAFLADQIAHMAVILFIAGVFPSAYAGGVWPQYLSASGEALYFLIIILVAGIIVTTQIGGLIIGWLIKPLSQAEAENAVIGLPGGGTYIGWLERFIVLMLVLTGNAAGIGFLITAKSILRFGDINSNA